MEKMLIDGKDIPVQLCSLTDEKFYEIAKHSQVKV